MDASADYPTKTLKELLKPTEQYKSSTKQCFSAQILQSPLGDLLAVADNEHLYMLQCIDFSDIDEKIHKLATFIKCSIAEGRTPPIDQVEDELNNYFYGEPMEFQTPIKFFGTETQIAVWKELQLIPWGEQLSYSSVAHRIGKPKAVRSVGTIIGGNPFIVIVPCHRVINKNGNLGGFSCGIERKKILLALEGKQLNFDYN